MNVRSYWPSVVASGAMLLATDALSIERTLGSYMLSACEISKSRLAEFAYLKGSAELLLNFAKSYDITVAQLLDRRIFNTWLQRNVTDLRAMILDVGFVEMCNKLTDVQRTKLTLEWADDIQLYIITIDELRGSFVIPSILQVNHSFFPFYSLQFLHHLHIIMCENNTTSTHTSKHERSRDQDFTR